MVNGVPPELQVLPPWDAVALLQLSNLQSVSVSYITGWEQLVPQNPFRWALWLGFPYTGGSTSTGCTLANAPSGVNNNGFGLTQPGGLFMTYPIYGPLVNLPWYAFASSATTVFVQEYTLTNWTDRSYDIMRAANSLAAPQAIDIPTGPGRPGGWNPWRYWQSLMAKLRGGK